ncbi:MAG TPA: type II toxin-antitoxin system PemK/MazF family toxin [Rhizomicrobium sp.]|nr:type II toxin-antitoxin system PemK/MazF family toxin [Rhizomicrobium sp.]
MPPDADKITTVPKSRLGTLIGRLGESDMARINRAVIVFLGLAGRRRTPASHS